MSKIDTAAERAKLAALEGHTPGPWDAHGLTVYDTCMDGVASCHTNADARLIAAAPDLLATTHRLLDALDAERARAEKAEAERDEWKDEYQTVNRLLSLYKDAAASRQAERDQALARLAVVQQNMREMAAKVASMFGQGTQGIKTSRAIETRIRAIPIDPDAEAALQRVVDATWNEAVEATARIADGWGNCARDDDMAREIRALKRPEAQP